MNKQLQRRPTSYIKHIIKKRKWMIKQIQRRQMLFVQHYFPVLSEQTRYRLQLLGEFLGIVLLTIVLAFIWLSNSAPIGITTQYVMGQDTKNISELGPKNRIQVITKNGDQLTKITDDLIYFTTTMHFNFDSATVKIYYQNPNPDQTFSVGFQDQQTWHYALKPFDAPFLNTLTWKRNGSDPTLYQKKQQYPSVAAFLKNPPFYSIIGTYDYDTFDAGDKNIYLPSYMPQKQETVITTPLRGNQTFYVYLNHEPFHMEITKQDLNWYEGPDPMTVSVYKDNELVDEVTEPDDGIIDESRKIQQPQTVSINSPDRNLPENGVYKVIVNANEDTIIKSIRTNLHKIVFSGSLFLAGNKNVYGNVASTSATTLYTNALSLSALTYHTNGEQQINVDNQILSLDTVQIPRTIIPQGILSKIFVPYNDVILTPFEGYFTFSPEQFFLPTKYYILPITNKKDVSLADYILADYTPPRTENGWQVNEQTFDLHNAFINNGKLSWLIESPNLKENNNSLMIKTIQVTFHKKGWNGVKI